MKFIVAMPVYDGKIPAVTVSSLLYEQALATKLGDEMELRFLPSCSHPAMGRNQLADDFLNSDAERLVFLDSDVSFEPCSLLRIARHPVDFAGGAYRYKMDLECYPVMWLPKPELGLTRCGLVEVETLPGGFLSLSRKVFESLKAAHPSRQYSHLGKAVHCFFQMPFFGENLYGEDSFFCKEWRDLGGQVFLDPELTLTHWDFNKPYKGHIGNWIKNRSQV